MRLPSRASLVPLDDVTSQDLRRKRPRGRHEGYVDPLGTHSFDCHGLPDGGEEVYWWNHSAVEIDSERTGLLEIAAVTMGCTGWACRRCLRAPNPQSPTHEASAANRRGRAAPIDRDVALPGSILFPPR